ncbi:MAG: MFS transporter [archaeon]|nr:MFS transporter [archaeon]
MNEIEKNKRNIEDLSQGDIALKENVEQNGKKDIVKRSGKYMIFLMIYLILYEVFDTYTTSYYSAIVSFICEDFGLQLNDPDYDFAIAIASIGLYLAIFIQMLSDKIGRKPMIIVAFFGMGMSSWLLGLSESIGSYTFALFLMYLFFSSDIWVIVISEEAPTDKRAKYNAIIGVFGMFPSVLIPILRDLIDPVENNWQIMTYFAIIAMPLAFLGLFLKETQAFKVMKQNKNSTSKYSKDNILKSISKPFTEKNRIKIFVFILAGFILGMNFAGYQTVEMLLTDTIKNLSFNWSDSFWGIFGIDDYTSYISFAILMSGGSSVIFFTLTGILAEKFGRRFVMYIYNVIFFLSALEIWFVIEFFSILPIMVSTMGIMSGYFFFNGSFWGNGKILSIFTLESFDTEIRGSVSGWKSLAKALGLTLGALFTGLLRSTIPIHLVYVIYAGFLVSFIPILTKKYLPETKGKDLIL